MKLKPLKPVESRIAAILLLLVALALAYLVLLHWWFVAPLQSVSGAMDDLRLTQARYAATIADNFGVDPPEIGKSFLGELADVEPARERAAAT